MYTIDFLFLFRRRYTKMSPIALAEQTQIVAISHCQSWEKTISGMVLGLLYLNYAVFYFLERI